MSKINKAKIKTESLPTRCEICHKTDRFDPLANYCSRCKDVVYEGNQKTDNGKLRRPTPTRLAVYLSILGSLVGIVMGMFLGSEVKTNEWEIENQEVIVFLMSILIWQIGLPFIFTAGWEKPNLGFIGKIFLWSIIGSLTAFIIPLFFNTVMIFYYEGTLDIHVKDEMNIKGFFMFTSMIGMFLGPIVGSICTWVLDKFRG